jgi:hypothetical protein
MLPLPLSPQTQVIIDPYAKSILSRRRYGELGAQLDYERDDVLGLAATWPQAAAFLPKPTVSAWTKDLWLGGVK